MTSTVSDSYLSLQKDYASCTDCHKKWRGTEFPIRLLAIVDPEFRAELSPQVRTDLTTFIEKMASEDIALQNLGLGQQSLEGALAELQQIYRVG